ncbi:unnamed protein product [Symbiodinium natans]|uniref:Uncharacterized protein n=1 Tax=Symbiodinium natans TaxID=878477 RepID=A0A812MH61_9DINO|nr:unnamed protein product [Symbiodinium natans]
MLRVATRTAILFTLAPLRALALAGPSCLDEDGYGTLLLQKEGRKVAREPSALSVQVDPENGICQPRNQTLLEREVPILEVLSKHPGEDGWCVFGAAGTWSRKCAVSRRKADPRMFAEYNNEVYKSYLPTSSMSKTLRLPDGRSLHNIVDGSYPLDDAYCWILGWYDLDRKAAVNSYTYLTEVSAASCRSLEQSIPGYHQISFGHLLQESEKDREEIQKLWASQEPVLNLSQDFVDGMKIHAAAKCLLGGGEGGVCDIAFCALRACRLGNDRLGYNLRGDCPPV